MKKEMIAVRKLRPAPGFELVTTEVRKPKAGEVLIKVKACSMCGTDVHLYDWTPPWSEGRFIPPKTIGHEVCGEVVEVGKGVTTLVPGDLVSAESHIPDWRCFQCQLGNYHICENLKFISIDIDGFFAEYAILPEANAWKNPKDMPIEIATLQESLGNSVYTVYSGDIVGRTVSVFGCGPTGLFAIALAKAAGASKIIAIGGTKYRLDLAKKMGADITINRHEKNVVEEIMNLTSGLGTDVFLEMSGSGEALNQGLRALRPAGRASILGLPERDVSLNISRDIVMKNIDIKGIYGRKIWETWILTSRLLSSRRLDVRPIITHRLKLEDYEKGIQAMKTGKSGKVVMFPPE